MQITRNTTGMKTALAVACDRDARDHCVVVVKGTFKAAADGSMTLDDEQEPVVETDEHYGDAETSAVRRECELVRHKPRTDVLVDGYAIPPGEQPTTELPVRLEVVGHNKDLIAMGERRWVRAAGGWVASRPVPFTSMPLRFDRAFGGRDDTRGPGRIATERRNLVGVGFHPHRPASAIDGQPLPNLEHPKHRMTGPRAHPPPVGMGVVGRAWKPRADFAGTYDARWLDELAPHLPLDFDERYHQAAPVDQQFPYLRGGDTIRCVHMARDPVVLYRLPSLSVPVEFCFRQRSEARDAVLDTVILQPHRAIAMLLWRASVPLSNKPRDLREILVGPAPRPPEEFIIGHRDGKPVFRGLAATLRWIAHARRGERPR